MTHKDALRKPMTNEQKLRRLMPDGNPNEIEDLALNHLLDAVIDDVRNATLEKMRAMRIDYRTMPHAQFPLKWPDWREWEEVLPSQCGCQDCRLWRSGS